MRLFLVGGAVRDLLLGLNPKDFDFVFTEATEEQILNLGYTQITKNFPVYSHKSYPEAQFCLARTETKIGKGYNGFTVNTAGVSLYDDLLRRDFTINAMAIEIQLHDLSVVMHQKGLPVHYNLQNQLVDYFNGLEHLKSKTLKHVGEHFVEDPLRMIRVARFKARLNLKIDSETKQLVSDMVSQGMFEEIHTNRIYLEFEKSISEGYGQSFVSALDEIGLLELVFKNQNTNLIRVQNYYTKNVKSKDKFFKILLYNQNINMKEKSFLLHIGMDTVLDVNEIYRVKMGFINYFQLETLEKAHLLYKSRFKGDVKKLVNYLRIVKINNPYIDWKSILQDFNKIKEADFSSVALCQNKIDEVNNILIKTLSS